jgi:8-oxo-dGTP diphosphatase
VTSNHDLRAAPALCGPEGILGTDRYRSIVDVYVHVVHHRNPQGQARIGFFFTAARWQGEPVNREPHKCARLYWADPARPPANTVPYTAAALAAITHGGSFSLDGW